MHAHYFYLYLQIPAAYFIIKARGIILVCRFVVCLNNLWPATHRARETRRAARYFTLGCKIFCVQPHKKHTYGTFLMQTDIHTNARLHKKPGPFSRALSIHTPMRLQAENSRTAFYMTLYLKACCNAAKHKI